MLHKKEQRKPFDFLTGFSGSPMLMAITQDLCQGNPHPFTVMACILRSPFITTFSPYSKRQFVARDRDFSFLDLSFTCFVRVNGKGPDCIQGSGLFAQDLLNAFLRSLLSNLVQFPLLHFLSSVNFCFHTLVSPEI